MNIQGFAPSCNFRPLEPKRPAARSEPSTAEPALPSPFGKDSARLPAVLTGLKSENSSGRETGSAPETTETRTETSVEDSAPEQDNMEDLSRDYEPVSERDDDDNLPDDDTEEQRQKKSRHLGALEAQYRSRFLLLDQLLDRLVAAHNILMLIKNRANEPNLTNL